MSRRRNIERAEIVERALEVLDESGLAALTMRRLADALGIEAASLYWHFPGKEALMDAMADALLVSVALDVPSRAGWERVVLLLARELRQALLARRDGARVFAGTYTVSENTLRIAAVSLPPLMRTGLSAQQAFWAIRAVGNYVIGFAIEEQGLFAMERAERRRRFEQLRESFLEKAPPLADAASALLDEDTESQFEFGLTLLIEGLRHHMRELDHRKAPKAGSLRKADRSGRVRRKEGSSAGSKGAQ